MIKLNIEEIKKVVEENNYQKVIMFLPAGLMPKASELKKVIPNPIFLASPCYGACDVPIQYLEKFKADALFNFGHSKPLSSTFDKNIHFFEVQVSCDLPDFVPNLDTIGLVYVIQFKNLVEAYKKKLESKGKKILLGKMPDFMGTYTGQVTGCDVGAAEKIKDEVDGFVVMSDGLFHANKVATIGKPTFNWEGTSAVPIKSQIAALFTAKTVGIVTSIKSGQFYKERAELARVKLEKQGKNVLFVAGDVITPEITNLSVDFWVVAACPRIAEDRYMKPSATVDEVLEYLND